MFAIVSGGGKARPGTLGSCCARPREAAGNVTGLHTHHPVESASWSVMPFGVLDQSREALLPA